MAGFERRREKLGIYFDVPGLGRIREPLKVKYTKENRREASLTIGYEVDHLIAARDWKGLLALFPENERLMRLVPGAELTVVGMLDRLERDYKEQKRDSLYGLQVKLAQMRPYFGQMAATNCTTAVVATYRDHLIKEGYANASVNRYLAALKRAFKLAVLDGRLEKSQMPAFNMMSEKGNERKGFFENDELEAVTAELPDYLRCLVQAAAITGWRKSGLLGLTTRDVDDNFLTLPADLSKNGKEWKFPLTDELRAVLQEQAAWVRKLQVQYGRIITWLFPNAKGEQMKDFRKAWASAKRRAGIEGDTKKHFHDFRRTAGRNMRRAGLTDIEVMSLVGHLTTSMAIRYFSKDETRLLEMGDKLTAKNHASNSIQPASNKLTFLGAADSSDVKKVSKIND